LIRGNSQLCEGPSSERIFSSVLPKQDWVMDIKFLLHRKQQQSGADDE